MQNKSKKLGKSFALLTASLFASVALTSCARVKIKDGEWCADAGRFGGECFHTLSDRERTIDKPAWDSLRFGWVCTDPANFAQWEAATLKLCRYTGICTWKEVQAIRALGERMRAASARR